MSAEVMDMLLVAVVVAPALLGTAMLLSAGPLTRAAAVIGIGTTAGAAAAAVPVVLDGTHVAVDFVAGASLGLAASGPATVLLPTILVVSCLVLVVASADPATRGSRFTGLMLLFTAAACLTVLATSLPALLLGWEVMGAASYVLIGYRYVEQHAVASGATAFLTTRAADLGLYLAAGAALAGGTDLGLDSLAGLPEGWRHVAAAGVLVAALGKAAQLPFSFWLARAMDGPAPVSALLHSAAMVALGGYLLVRTAPTLAATGWAGDVAAWSGAATAVLMGAVALVQSDLKLLLAASTSAQLGFVVLAAGVGATAAGTAHLVAHAAVKALLFLAAGAWLTAAGTKQLAGLSGAARRWPAVGVLASAALLALAGVPPLSLWGTKDAVLAAALEHSPALYAAGLVATVLAAGYAGRALIVLLRGRGPVADHEPEEPPSGRVPSRIPLALAPLAVGAVGLGLLALPRVLGRLPGDVPSEPHAAELLGSGVLSVLTVGLVAALTSRSAAARDRRGVPVLRAWLHLEAGAHAVLVRPCLRAAELAARVDDEVLTRGVAAVATRTLAATQVTARGDWALDRAVRGVASAARGSGRLVRRTSGSGQLHHYYLQLVGGVLGVLAALTVVVLVGSPR